MLHPGAIFELKILKNKYSDGVSPHWGAIAPRVPSWFSGSRFAAGKGGRKREGVAFPHFFFNLTTAQQ